MEYKLKRLITASQRSYIENQGDAVWEWMTDNFKTSFNVSEVARCPLIAHYAASTQVAIARCIIANVEAAWEHEPEMTPFVRRGNWYFWR